MSSGARNHSNRRQNRQLQPRRRRALALAALLTAVVAVGGCSSHSSSTGSSAARGSTGSSNTDSSNAGSGNAGSGNAGSGNAGSGNAGSQAGAVAAPEAVTSPKSQVPVQQRDIVRTATLSLQATDVDRAANLIGAQATAAGGRIDGDDRNAGGADRTAHLVLRLPPQALDRVLASAVRLGHETGRSVHGEDVTATRADVAARVAALRTSVDRLRNFLSKSGSITDLVRLESALSERESTLESTVAQQRALADQIGLATLTVDISSPAATAAISNPSGFGAALSRGWHGLVLALGWLLTGLGYVIPFAALAALIMVPVVLIRRRRQVPAPLVEPPPA